MASARTAEMAETRGGGGLLLRVMRLLRVRPEEGAATLWTAALFAASQANQGLGLNTADTLFFLRFGVEFLPTMILLSGPVVMVGILVYAAGLGRIGSQRWLPAAFLGLGGVVLLERVGIAVDLPAIFPIVWLVGQVAMMLSLTAMWTAASEVCTTRQAKRLYPVFASAGIAGGVIGNAATGPLARALGTENLLLIQAGLLFAAATLAAMIGRRFYRTQSDPSEDSVLADFRSGLKMTLDSPLLRMVALVGVAFGALLFLVVFPFSEIVTASFESEADVAGYLGFFAAAATAITFFVSLFGTNRLFARLGVVAALMAVPVVYVGGFALWLVSFNLLTATLIRGVQFVSVNAIGGTAWSSLFNVLPARRRGQVMAFMTAGPMQLGTVISGVLLLAGGELPQQVRISLGLAVAVGALVLVWRMRGRYGDALVDAVRRGLVDMFTAPTTGMQKPPLDADAFRAMSICLDDPRPAARAMAVVSLGRLEDEEAGPLLRKALRDEEARVRSAALDVLFGSDGEWLEHADVLLSDPVADIRRRTLEMIWKDGSLAMPAIEATLEDPDPSVRAMAAVVVGGGRADDVVGSLLRSDEVGDIRAALDAIGLRPDLTHEDLTSFLDHPDRRVRAAAAKAVAPRTGSADRVGVLLDDPSIVTRRAAAEALARTDEGVAALLQILETGSVRATDAALRALTEAGRGGRGLRDWASQEIARASYLRRHRLALEQIPDRTVAARYLLRLLTAREERLERWAVTALTTPATEAAMGTVVRGIWSDDAETQSQAMEALDSLGDRGVLRGLLALLEEDPSYVERDPRASLRELTSDFDSWIRALAFRCLRDELMGDLTRLVDAVEQDPAPLVQIALSRWDLPTMQETETLDVMERVLALQQARMFSEIDPEDLERIAFGTRERWYQPEERIFRQGEEGAEILVIIDGEVVISREVDGESKRIRSYGPGDHVGELSLLRGQPRASDVTAGPDGVHALVLHGTELQAILEERPEVAMAMLGTLAERLATM